MKRIIFLDKGTLNRHNLDFEFPYEMTNIDNCPHHEAAATIAGHDIVITNKVPITREVMEKNPQMKLVAVAATGFNHVDMDAANELGVTICNVADYSTISVAEHTFMMMIALMHRLPCYQKRIGAGEWQESPFFSIFKEPIYDLEGKTVGIVGRGNIGSKFAQFAKAFDMKVLFSERKNATTIREGYHSFDEVLEKADVYSIHAPLNDHTLNLIDVAEIERMKDEIIIINVSRGGIVNEAALAAGLKSGKVGGAGLDVMTSEPPKEGNPLLDPTLNNLIITPHTGWGSEEALARFVVIIQNNINNFVAGTPINVVNQ